MQFILIVSEREPNLINVVPDPSPTRKPEEEAGKQE